MASAFDTTLSNLGINRTTSGVQVQASAKDSLGQQDVLALMTAQMKNQDPFDPVDNTQMVAQMAQFSSLAGISEMNTTLKSISERLAATSAGDAMSYIGRTVLTEGNTAYGRTSGGIAGAIELGGDADQVNVTISDANGQLLKSVKLGAHAAGTIDFDWDGKTDAGADAGQGPFTINVLASKGGASVAAQSLVWAPVAAVTMPSDGVAQLTLPGVGQVPTTAVRRIG